jgi:hypothetical protein
MEVLARTDDIVPTRGTQTLNSARAERGDRVVGARARRARGEPSRSVTQQTPAPSPPDQGGSWPVQFVNDNVMLPTIEGAGSLSEFACVDGR